MTADIVLWLDLAEENQQNEASVREAVPPGAEILRLTAQGVTQCPNGTPQKWRPVLDAIDRLVHQARKYEQQSQGCHYWVTGRAGLPAFVHIGHRLSKMASVTFVHQPPNGGKPVRFPLGTQRSAAGSRPTPQCFARTPKRLRRSDSNAPVALAVSSRKVIPDSLIEKAFTHEHGRPAAITHLHTDAWIEPSAVPAAMHEIDELIGDICAAHPARATLALFIAGPSMLAFLVGNAINPRVCRDVQVFDFPGDRYYLVYELPYPPVPDRSVAVWLGASPAEVKSLELEEEIRGIQLALSQAGLADRIAISAISVARPMDLYSELENRKPTIVQFSGHGHAAGPLFQDDSGKPRPLLAAELGKQFHLAGDSVRVVVLAACFSESYTDELRPHVDCVIAMRGKVGDTDARVFARELYRSLAKGDSVQTAFDRALNVMRLERQSAGATMPVDDEAPRLHERYPGCANRLSLVRKP